MKKYKILAVEWRSALYTIGFVAYATENPAKPGEWNSVVGFVPELIYIVEHPETDEHNITSIPLGGQSPDADAQYIAANGAKIEWNIAKELFPQLNVKKHKYYHGV